MIRAKDERRALVDGFNGEEIESELVEWDEDGMKQYNAKV